MSAGADHFFAGAFGGDEARLDPAARLECRICWHIYDPAEGCAAWQVPPGTPFAALPEQWTCPECDSPRDGFLLVS